MEEGRGEESKTHRDIGGQNPISQDSSTTLSAQVFFFSSHIFTATKIQQCLYNINWI